MKIITCASYYGSGSSALTDLVAEYENVKDLTNYEFRFLYDIDGVSDLEYHLVENHDRHNAGHALKRFQKLCDFNAGNFMSKRCSAFMSKDEYHRIISRYIDSLTDFKYKGWWFYDLYDKGIRTYYLYQIFNHIFAKIPFTGLKILKNEYTLCSHPGEEQFLEQTRRLVSEFLAALNKENMDFLEIDQIAPSANTERILRYFKDECYVFIVDRDPRDVYLMEKYVWRERVCPNDVELFCKWFAYAREAGSGVPKDHPHIIKIRYEDLIYRYDESVNRIERKVGLNPRMHKAQFTKMNPRRSVVNTRLWERYSKEIDNIKIIEKRLKKYLYQYDDIPKSALKGIDVQDRKLF